MSASGSIRFRAHTKGNAMTHRPCRHIARLAVLLVAASTSGFDASAATPADLERAFWVCDRASTLYAIDSSTAGACSAITEELKSKKFSGDFNAMLAWWRVNKESAHQALEAANVAQSAR